MHKIRVILDAEEDVIRTILVDSDSNLEQLHQTINTAFGFDNTEMASFYLADEEWNEGEEISLFDMDTDQLTMQNCIVKSILPNVDSKLIYVYDFMNMWTFYVEVLEINTPSEKDLPKVILTVGKMPKKAPTKNFKAEKKSNQMDEDFFDTGDFDNIDDFNFDEY